ncbi:MAG TPA: hypothetical protein VLD57_00700 [Blastocatellia bacterium]|nr:hypothetical protein [Blastocatellia bacterium]
MSSSRPVDTAGNLERAERLKRELAEFVTKGPLKDIFTLQQKLYFELSDPADEHETENMLDWFLFDWFDENGETVIGHYFAVNPDISNDDCEVLRFWEDSINSVFKTLSVGKRSLRLEDLESKDCFEVITSIPLDQTPFKRGQYLAARLLPLGEQFIFSGLQFIMADRQSAIEALQMRQALEELDSPEALEKARKEQCSAFCEFFGCSELSLPSVELNRRLEEFQDYIFTKRRDPETGRTAADMFKERFGRELKMAEMPPPPESVRAVGEVTILCDEFDGLVLLPDYNRFKRVFEVDRPDREAPDWQDLVWNYIKNPDIPIVAFQRIAEEAPDRVEKVLRTLLKKRDFSIEHLYAVLLHYKEPVEGFDDLTDDQRLWDIFSGNGKTVKTPKKSQKSSKTKPKAAGRSRSASGARTASKRGSKKKAAPRPRAAAKTTASRTSRTQARKTSRPKTTKRSAAKKR